MRYAINAPNSGFFDCFTMSAGVGNARIVSLYAVNKISGAKTSSMSWSQATVPTTETARMDRIVVLNAVSGIVTSCSQLLSPV